MRITRFTARLATVLALTAGVVAVPTVAQGYSIYGHLTATNDVMKVAGRCTDLANWYRSAQTKVDHIPRPALVIDWRVQAAAQAHSTQQMQRMTMSHDGFHVVSGRWVLNSLATRDAGYRIKSSGFVWSWWGENVAAGQSNCDVVVRAWMGSPHHRENILKPQFTRIGMAARRSANGVMFWTMDLARAG
jgi:uncharacterized protein YkwD